MHKTSLNIKIIAGSTREGRFSDKPAQWVARTLAKKDGVTAEVLDLRDYDMPFFDQEETPSAKTAPYAHDAVARFTKKIAEGDAFVFVTPEYNHSTSGVLKNALDWVYQEWHNKPAAFVGYGSAGGARAIEQLRLMAVELQMASVRNAVHIWAADYFPAYFGKTSMDELFDKYTSKLDDTLDQLLPWAEMFKALREKQ